MGSMRNPVGPLPSSIYWRRRAILGAVLVLVALLAVWLVNALGGGGGGKKDGAQGSGGSSHPAPSITPGPSGSGPAISQQPGGRDESDDSGEDGDGSGSPGDGSADGASGGTEAGSGKGGSGEDGSGDGSGNGSQDANGADGEGGSGGSGTAAGAGSSDARRVPAGSSLPDCTSDVAELSLRSAHNTYEPGKKPKLELSVKNTSAAACKVDLGAARTVVTITLTGEDSPYWSSKDCPATESLWLRVPAKETIRYDIEWNRKASRAACAKPPSGSAKPGTYLVEAKAPGLEKARTSFRLDKD